MMSNYQTIRVVGASFNIRLAVAIAAATSMIVDVRHEFDTSDYDRFTQRDSIFGNHAIGNHIDYQYSEQYKAVARKQLKYRQSEIQQRRKSLVKRYAEKATQMARKQSRRREKSFVSTYPT